MLKIFIALSTFNRKTVTSLCLENLKKIVEKDNYSLLSIYDDASTSYDIEYLKKFSDNVLRFPKNGGIERSRARSVRDFIYIYENYDLFYMTDNDTIHDPNFLNILRTIYQSSSSGFEKKLPIGMGDKSKYVLCINVRQFLVIRLCTVSILCWLKRSLVWQGNSPVSLS